MEKFLSQNQHQKIESEFNEENEQKYALLRALSPSSYRKFCEVTNPSLSKEEAFDMVRKFNESKLNYEKFRGVSGQTIIKVAVTNGRNIIIKFNRYGFLSMSINEF
jgi:hypothetical protein